MSVKEIDLINSMQKQTRRDYLARMNDDKVACMLRAREYGKDFWDGDRRYGYGGYKYDGRWKPIAKELIKRYDLKEDAKILDIGCGKGYLLYELKKLLPKSKLTGIDVSEYAINEALIEGDTFLFGIDARNLRISRNEFDLIVSLMTLHNIPLLDIPNLLKQIEWGAKNSFICVESYRNAQEQFNLQCWALTAETIIDTKSWEWLFQQSGYTGDYEFVCFE
jgi:SAM-dependent methyltransferase